jgi:hypothetical protein
MQHTRAGELAEYVVSELNVVSLETCDDVLAYAELVAEPEWQLLGKKLGKDMGKVRECVFVCSLNTHLWQLCVVHLCEAEGAVGRGHPGL